MQQIREKHTEYTCILCEYITRNKSNYNKHVMTGRHRKLHNNQILERKNATKSDTTYYCESCDYCTYDKRDYTKHLHTRKHNLASEFITNKQYNCSHCSKTYCTQSGLWKHKKKCSILQSHCQDEVCSTHHMVHQLLADNRQLRDLLQEQQSTIAELIPKVGTQTNSNNTFNIQMFLNDDCRNAINMTDFIRTIQLEINDMLNIGNNGYVEGISDIFIKALKKLEITERPIHCTDTKRETVYIKEEDKWEKGTSDTPSLHGAIKYIDRQNLGLISKWMIENPDSQDLDTPENIQLMKMYANSLGQGDDQSILDKKVLKRVLPVVRIGRDTVRLEN